MFGNYWDLIWAGTFVFCILINTVCYYELAQIKKSEYPNLWEKDSKKSTWWTPTDRLFFYEIAWKKPYWIEENKNARMWFLFYRITEILTILSFTSPIIYIFGKYYLLDNGN